MVADRLTAAGDRPILGDFTDCAAPSTPVDHTGTLMHTAQLTLEEKRETVSANLDRLAGTGKNSIFASGTGVLSQRTDGDWSEDSFAEAMPLSLPIYWCTQGDGGMVRAAANSDIRAFVIRPPADLG